MEYVVVYTLMVSITAMFGWFVYIAHTGVKEEEAAEKAAIALVLKKKAKKQRLSKKKRIVS